MNKQERDKLVAMATKVIVDLAEGGIGSVEIATTQCYNLWLALKRQAKRDRERRAKEKAPSLADDIVGMTALDLLP